MQYNMYLTHGSLLIEVGTDANTLDEAVYSGSLLGDVLVDVLDVYKRQDIYSVGKPPYETSWC